MSKHSDEAGFKTIGVAEDVAGNLYVGCTRMMKHINEAQGDRKQRHFVLFVVTDEGTDDRGQNLLATDVISSMEGEDTMEIVTDWLHRKRQ